ncbi:ArsR family transcriptional regulator [Bacillus toyonensis]|uniref:ArsR/SmtB family transcription factor n=1 Tax=Bacillus toyonensis TaxID=155322 RepID=UPI003D1E1ADB
MSNTFQMEFKQYERDAEILDVLGEATCLLIVRELIVRGPLSASELSAAIDVSNSIILQHLQKLNEVEIVICERKGLKIYCRVEDEKIIKVIQILGLLN